jgi:hypothetical protein
LVRLGNQSFEDVPFDIYRGALQIDLSLASQFELLDPRIIRGLAREDLLTLKEAYDRRVDHFLGEKGTKEFVLQHVFDVNSVVFNSTAGVLRWLLSLHYRARQIPKCLLDELVKEIKRIPGMINWPLREIVSKQEAFYAFLQEHWAVFLEQAAAGGSYAGFHCAALICHYTLPPRKTDVGNQRSEAGNYRRPFPLVPQHCMTLA